VDLTVKKLFHRQLGKSKLLFNIHSSIVDGQGVVPGAVEYMKNLNPSSAVWSQNLIIVTTLGEKEKSIFVS
jgi:hypothetical protein